MTIAGKSPTGDAAPPVLLRARIAAKNVHTYFLSTSRVLRSTNTIGRIIMTAVMLFKHELIRNIIPPNIMRHRRFLPLDISAILIAKSCIMPVSAIKLVNNSMTIRMARTS